MTSLSQVQTTLSSHKAEFFEVFKVTTLAVFDSFARNEQRSDSDVDILVEFNSPVGIEFIDLGNDLERILNLRVDLVARWGGDEFVILTIGAPGETSDMIIARIHTKLQQHNSESSAPYDLACSIGVTPVPNDDQKSFDSLIAEADEAMYQEKRRRKLNSIAA